MAYGDVVWNANEYKLKFVTDNPNFPLPQLVRVVQGYMVDEDDAIASGQVLTLHGKKKIDKLSGTDIHGRSVNIPLNCPYKVKVLALGNARTFKSVEEICNGENPPKHLSTTVDTLLHDDTVISSGTCIEIGDHLLNDDGTVLGMTCRIGEKSVTIPLSFKGEFVETLSPEVLTKRYALSDMVKEFGLPVQIQFLPVNERNCGYGPQLGNITVKEKQSQNCILATSFIDNVRYALTFSSELPITVQVSTTKEGSVASGYDQQSQIDLTKFDYIDSSDPYSSVEIRNQIYEELKTPRPLTRRHHSANSMSNTPVIPRRPYKPPEMSSKRSKSTEFTKDLEKLVKSKFGLKRLKRSVSKLRGSPSKESMSRSSSSIEYDAQSAFNYGTSDDGSSSAGACSLGVTSNDGSEGTCHGSFQHIIDCMDAMSMNRHNLDVVSHSHLDAASVARTPRSAKRHSRKSSGDSGICIHRKQTRSRSNDSKSQNGSDCFDTYSEWNLNSTTGSTKSSIKPSSVPASSANYLWSRESSISDKNNNPKTIVGLNSSLNSESFLPSATSEAKIIEQSSNISTQDISPLNNERNARMEALRTLNEDGVSAVLDELKLSEFKSVFQENQINGELLMCIELDELTNELKLSAFQARKLLCYVKGWRPENEATRSTREISRRNSLNPRDWSENDVYTHLNTINLSALANFCRENQVNGELLLDILDKQTLLSLQQEHSVKMSSLESKKLLNFVVRGWRPDSSPKKTAMTV